ncbi:PREDICTED: myosin-4-like [Nelumbo nucifera]|uniref:Myosin-4-like n=1 Tax=Nelumbo nucifera TaxID=4432 RepID=A0A1U7ZLD0_NELNU|nr:PREDICTED: myosin-4-like [Nelumbo nucifera]XP_010248697.1 PREDICTED: myosin-4-like [Nelumbo nucifera]
MASAGDEDADAVLSDVEGDDPVPSILDKPPQEDISVERFREILAELERERKAREAAEVSFNRLKVLTHEAIKKRDESGRQRDEALREKENALRSNEKISGELTEALRLKDELLKQRDDAARQLDEAVKARDSSRSEIEVAAQLLVTGIEKISGKVSNFKNFSGTGLPRSQKYTGLPTVAYGIIKRSNEIVEELLRQLDTAIKSRNDAREQMEHRNYEIAIEVSQLEATISGLRQEIAKKTSEVENLAKSLAEKDTKILEMDKEMSERINELERESTELREMVKEYDFKLRSMESKMDSQKPLLADQLNYVSKIHDQIYDVIKMVDANKSDQLDLSESLFLPQEMDMTENLHASLAGMESIYVLTKIAAEKIRDEMDERSREVKGLNETVDGLVKEKQHIGSLLRGALSRRMISDPSSKMTEVLQVAENGLKEAGVDFRFGNLFVNGEKPASHDKLGFVEVEDDEVYTLAGALENIVKESQQEIIELRHSVDELRAESSLLKSHMEVQTKELSQRKHRIEELEEKERVANESIEGLMMDIAAAEEEIARWKMAAEQEAAAGRSIEQEFVQQLSSLRQELDEAKQAMIESEKKLKFKEETAAAAMAARDAAEKSLRLADLRASRLSDRVEELTHQLEESDTREDSRNRNRQRYACWPWQWLGINFVGFQQAEMQQQQSNEMELSEPLL